jgi:hypothetical protein
MQLPNTFVSGGRRLFEIKFTKRKEKVFIKAKYKNNVTIFSSSVALV